ncbi:uncharacterized protein LOC126371039 [Pectinophora gossypiella]|uniref:uncharacterized protein LOC126371039 n=1 Tax=Pectinophora gossypiella TaxID=13191 RepID=UPI00214E86B0|nr:uncharacterized protein LOC126371039 [Pectinophora gossypiella]XP_049872199.1 uncharacterized protein LOC126371039 [Pectinophora gossypiella]
MNTITKGKIPKRKIQIVEFGAENIDNTAPVKKILEDLHHANSQAFSFYCQTMRPRRASKTQHYNFHFVLTGHPVYGFTDDWEGGLNSGYFEPFPYKSMMPKMITSLSNMNKSDPLTDYMKVKNDWICDCKNLRQIIVSNSMLDKFESFNEDVVRCPKQFIDIAAHLESDPDPYFDDSYNWYYAGNGNMQLICINWIHYILRSVFNKLYLLFFNKEEFSLHPEHVAIFNCDEDENIFETICSSHNIVALRTKNKVYILKIVPLKDEIVFEKIKAVESELPFTSISFDNHHKNILYITTLDNKVTIVNLDRLTGRTVKLKSKIDTIINNWNMVISSDRLTYTHVSKNSINVYDKRTNHVGLSWNGVRDTTDHLNCNDITVAKQCQGSMSLYYGTDHHLFLMDLRHEHKVTPKPVMRWTHGMQCMPTYISMCNFEFNKEIICLSSQWCEDVCVVPTYINSVMKGPEIPGVTTPYRPPSILNTLNEAREKLLCFDLYSPVDDRLTTSITGQIIIEHGENYAILMHNSLGDISCTMMYPEHMESFVEDDSFQNLHEWSKSFQLEKRELEISSLKDISNVWKNLKRVPDSYKFGEIRKIKDKSKIEEKEIFYTFEKEELDSGLLDVWIQNNNETTVKDSSLAIHLHYSDDSNMSE